MRIGFFCVFRRDPQPYALADRMIASVRATMPAYTITQLTDLTSPPCDGIDDLRRLPPGPMLERRIEHYSLCTAADWLLLDTDVELRADVSSVFPPHPFDVALADRNWPHLPQGDAVMHTMPFNTGVVFSRNPAFWLDVLAVWRAYPPEARDWMSEQRAVYHVVRTGRYLVQILPGQIYNYPPASPEDSCIGAKIVHHKGPRKDWWLARPSPQAQLTVTT